MSPYEHDREDVVSGNVWPDRSDPLYVEWLERRVRDLEDVLAKAEEVLARRDAHATETLRVLDEVVARLTAEGHGPPPRPWHPAGGGAA